MIIKLILAGILLVVFPVNGRFADLLTSRTSPPAVLPPFASPPTNQPPSVNPDAFICPDKYPNPRRDESVQDKYAKCVVIKDPYRWIENTDSPEAQQFIKDEMAITKPYLEKSPFRKEIKARYLELWNHTTYNGPFQKGKKFFSYRNTGLQNQDVLYIHDTPNDEGKVFLDPNTLSKDQSIVLDSKTSSFSEDGSIFAYLTSKDGSDWRTLQFKNVENSDTFKEKLNNLKFTEVLWLKDNKGVFFQAIPGEKTSEVDKNPKIFYHILGTDQSKDVVVAEFPELPDSYIDIYISDDHKYLIVCPAEGTSNNMVYVADLEAIKYEIKEKLKLTPLVTNMEANYWFITNIDTKLIFQTNKNADNYKLVMIDFTKPNMWSDLVPEDKKNVLKGAGVAWDKYLVLNYIVDVKNVLQLHEVATGKMIKKFDLKVGTVNSLHSSKKYKDIYFNFESFLTPGIIHHCDLSNTSFNLEVFKEIKLENFDRTKYTAEQIFFNSKDGTKVPMYIVYKKGLQRNGNNFIFMYGYGGYGVSLLPHFSVTGLLVVDNLNGLHVVVNIRGGGEYGEKWHKDGSLDKKQNSFDDFQAAAEFLIKEKYTNNKLLVINGGSNGGTLVLACLNQRPDLFRVVIADVPGCDMLRYDKFTSGKASITEYGTATNDTDFKYLIKYSPLHNIKLSDCPDKQYPATMLTTADHDERVLPLEPLKFIATLQYEAKNHPNQKNPLIIRVETGAGHNGRNTDKLIEEYVDMMCFIIMNTGIKFHHC